MSKIQNLPPASLTISPLLERILMLSAVQTEDSAAEHAAGVASVVKAGKIRVPLKVLEGTTEVVDGRHRREWAMAAGLETVPVEYVTEADALEIIRCEIFARRSITKGQKAWLQLWLVPQVAAGVAGRPKEKDIECPVANLEDAATAAGVSRSLMKEAAALYRIFTTGKRFTTGKNAAKARAEVEASIWAGDGLGLILSGIKDGPGKDKPGKPPADPVQEAAEEAARVADDYARMLTEWATQLDSVQSYALLPPLALHTTSTELTGHAASMAVAAIKRPDLPAAQRLHILDSLRQALALATTAAKAAGLKA